MKIINIDSAKGGNGDIWMRLTGLYIMAALNSDIKINIRIPEFFVPIAKHVFGDRLTIQSNCFNGKKHLTYTSLGIRHLIKPILSGNSFISTYAKTVMHDSKKRSLKNSLNFFLYSIAETMGLIRVPSLSYLNCYQGFQEIASIRQFKKITYPDFNKQLNQDAPTIQYRLLNGAPVSNQLFISDQLKDIVLVYPSGTSRQFVPLWWAKQYLPDAYYAFFYKDKTQEIFNNASLKTIKFYNEPGDIIELAKYASWIISTDSFPSHLLQYAFSNCTIAITEVSKKRIITPVFKGKIADAVASCHPCLHLDRGNHPLCAAGYSECINWSSKFYSTNLISN